MIEITHLLTLWFTLITDLFPHTIGAKFHFPMDEVDGDQLIGLPINATLNGSPSLVPGVVDNAMYFSGANSQHASFGKLDEPCLTNIDLCTEGFTFSFWVKLPSDKNGVYVGYGCNVARVGACFRRNSNVLKVEVKNTTHRMEQTTTEYITDEWMHVAMCMFNDRLALYLNGQNVGSPVLVENSHSTTASSFLMGTAANAGWGEVTLDEFLFWPQARCGEFSRRVYDLYLLQ